MSAAWSLFGVEQPDFERDGRDWPNRAASRFVRAAGLRWHVQEMGEGPQLLLLHGTGGATHSFRDLAPRLAGRFRVLIPDLPGHGFTEGVPSPRLSLPEMARSVGALVRSLSFSPVAIVAHSAGTAIAIRATLDGLTRPDAIIGFNAALMPFRGPAQIIFPAVARLIALNPFAPRFAAWRGANLAEVRRLIEGTGSTIDERGLDLYRRLFATSGHCAAALGMMARWDLEPTLADLPKLGSRLVLVAAGGDKAVPPGDAARVAALRPGTEVVAMPGLGHLAHEERPDAALAIIERVVFGA